MIILMSKMRSCVIYIQPEQAILAYFNRILSAQKARMAEKIQPGEMRDLYSRSTITASALKSTAMILTGAGKH
jgi:hypothetical protein